MRPFLLIILASLFGFFFSKTWYNLNNGDLETLFLKGENTFIQDWVSNSKNRHFKKHQDYQELNLVSFISKNTQKKDSSYFLKQDSLLATINSANIHIESKVLSKSVSLNFLKKFKSPLIQQVGVLTEKELEILDDLILDLKEALRKDEKNKIARHNLTVFLKLKKHADYYYNKAHSLSELIYEQLSTEMNKDSALFKDLAPSGYESQFSKEIESIRTETKKTLCKNEIKDSLVNIISTEFLKKYHEETIDSIKTYDNIDTELIQKLKSSKTTEQIVKEFYEQEFPTLYRKTSGESFSKILTDEPTTKTVRDIVYKYLDPDQKKKNPENEDGNQDKKEEQNKEQKNKNQEEKNSEKNKQDKKSGNPDKDQKKEEQNKTDGDAGEPGEQNSSDSNKDNKQSKTPKNELEKRQKEQANESEHTDKKKDMLDQLKDRKDKKKQESTYDQGKPDSGENTKTDEGKSQKNKDEHEGTPHNQGANTNTLEKDKMTKDNAEQTLKALEQKADRYLQNQKRAQRRDLEYGNSKPDW